MCNKCGTDLYVCAGVEGVSGVDIRVQLGMDFR